MPFYLNAQIHHPLGQPATSAQRLIEQAGPPSAAWAQYTDRRRTFSTAFWLHYILGLAGAHRFYVGRKGSGWAQLVLGLGSILAFLATLKFWGTGAIVFFLPLSICGVWTWWDGYNLRDMVREHNYALAKRVGLNARDTEEWERVQVDQWS